MLITLLYDNQDVDEPFLTTKMSTSDPVVPEPAPEITAYPSFGLTSTPFLTSALHHLKTSASNATSSLNSSGLFTNIPRWLGPLTDGWGWLQSGGNITADAAGERALGIETTIQVSAGAPSAAASAAAGNPAMEAASASAFHHAFTFQHVRNFGGVFSYMTSKWALACFTLVCHSSLLICCGWSCDIYKSSH